MEYSTERMREKVQMIKGSVQIDNSNMVDTWMRLAMSAAQAGNQKEAYDYYSPTGSAGMRHSSGGRAR